MIIYSCVPTIYLIHFSGYIIDQHNVDKSPQCVELYHIRSDLNGVFVPMLNEAQERICILLFDVTP